MTAFELSQVLGDISEKYISEASDYKKEKKPSYLRWTFAVSAAVAALVLVIFLGKTNSEIKHNYDPAIVISNEQLGNYNDTAYDLAAPTKPEKKPKKISKRTEKEIRRDYVEYLKDNALISEPDFDETAVLYLGTYGDYIAVKLNLNNEAAKDSEQVTEAFVSQSGRYGPILITYSKAEPILLWKSETGFVSISEACSTQGMSISEVFLIYYYHILSEPK